MSDDYVRIRGLGYDRIVSGVAGRIREILRECGLSDGALSIAAGKTRSHVSGLLKKLDVAEDAEVVEGHIEWDTFRALARVGGYEPGWLASGRGEKKRVTDDIDDGGLPNRARAEAAARLVGIGEDAIALARSRTAKVTEDMAPSAWLLLIQAAQQEIGLLTPLPASSDQSEARVHRLRPQLRSKPGS